MQIMKEYTRDVHITSYDVDNRRQLRLANLLAMCQESSEQQLALYGLDHGELIKRGMAFLLMRTQVQFHRMPWEGEDVQVSVCPRGVIGAQCYREFHMHHGDEVMIEIMESWALVDMETRKILNPKILDDMEIDVESYRGKCEYRLNRIKTPDSLPLLAERPIYYSDLDFNGHVGNFNYAKFVVDALPSYRDFNPGSAAGRPAPRNFSKFWLNYINEIKFGETLRLYGEESESGFLVYAQTQAGRSFECKGEY